MRSNLTFNATSAALSVTEMDCDGMDIVTPSLSSISR